jgi:hypothetical protein
MLHFSLLALTLATAPLAQAQTRPTFTGDWTMDMTRSQTAAQRADASPRTPVKITIADHIDSVTISRDVDGHQERATYTFEKLPLAERPVGTAGTSAPSERTVEPVSVEWKEGRLVTTTIYRVNGVPMKKIERRTLSADGREMEVETQLQVEHGYETRSKDPQGYTMVKDVYVKGPE